MPPARVFSFLGWAASIVYNNWRARLSERKIGEIHTAVRFALDMD